MRSKQIRTVAFLLHRYIGLFIGILAAAIGLTASLLIILIDWMPALSPAKPIPPLTPVGDRLPISTLIAKARAQFPDVAFHGIEFPKDLTSPILTHWDGYSEMSAKFNPYSGELIGKMQDNDYRAFLYDLHFNLLGRLLHWSWGGYAAGIVGLLATILCITGIVLWPGWRKLTAGFKIKWNANIKRLNFDLHKVAGIVVAVFLAMAMGTGFIWNFGQWTNPIIYALTFSPQPVEAAAAVSKPIANQRPLTITESLLQKASDALPSGEITSIWLPVEPKDVIQVSKIVNDNEVSAYLDQFSGEIIKVDKTESTSTKSFGDRVFELFDAVHYGTFAGEASRIFYVFVGLSPSILLVTGFIMWRNRKPTKPKELLVQIKQES
jgi:uncharacterized iron-regulated membrane protein